MDPLTLSFSVVCSPEHAFAVWTTKASAWWPAGHTISGERGTAVIFEPRAGGRVYERSAEGVESEWGEVVIWEPPDRLVYIWHMTMGAENPTEVEITFTAEGDTTAVSINHRGWERFGADAERRRAGNRAGWEDVVPTYQRACLEIG
jgi:uncharacterized protein YndB with AHSA1/START domain